MKTRPRRIVSVRARLVAMITIVAALGMLLVGVAVYAVEHNRILAQIDERLEASVESARFIVEQGPQPGGSETWESASDALSAVVQRMSPDDNTGAIGISNGVAALAPGVAQDVDLLAAEGFVPRIAASVADQPVRGTYAEEGVTWRYVAVPIHLEGADTVVFAMAYDVEAELAEINDSAQVFLIAGAIVLLALAGVAWLVAGRLLRPLRLMRETAEQISARSLSDRLPIEGRDDVSELARTMNSMLDRLDAAMDSQRQLVSDVGHEMKTPITIVLGYLEVMDANNSADVHETRELVTDELDRMATLVQDLASAARLHGPAPIATHETDAADLVRQIIRKAEGIDGVAVETGPIADAVVSLDPGRVTQAMLQLAQNGVTHGGGELQIGSRITESDLVLWVRDHGPGVPAELREAVFERFYKSDEGGTGLGLNIVDVIARAHGGSASVADPPDGAGALFTITLPRHTTAPQERTGRGLDSHRR